MPKVVGFENNVVLIGMDDGTLQEYDICLFNFDPQLHDPVEIFRHDDRVVISKAGAARTAGEAPWNGGVNINVNAGTSSTYHVVNKVLYAVFAILLGDLGVHEFYAGYIGRGVVSLLFFWTGIPAIIGLIKGIVALTRGADSAGNIQV